ncbi:EAL domain-containing protein [Tardiphaga sp.]|uniref:EAL domain-containing protein n=1 Tax=Tardiphaga sp. TaxID=1926292 RepID=UPI003438CA30
MTTRASRALAHGGLVVRDGGSADPVRVAERLGRRRQFGRQPEIAMAAGLGNQGPRRSDARAGHHAAIDRLFSPKDGPPRSRTLVKPRISMSVAALDATILTKPMSEVSKAICGSELNIRCTWAEKERLLVRAMIQLSHDLGYRVVGEGVETAIIQQWLCEMQCDEAQGYFISRPLETDQLEAWMRDDRRSKLSLAS